MTDNVEGNSSHSHPRQETQQVYIYHLVMRCVFVNLQLYSYNIT